MKYLHALLARDRENLQENPRALLLLTCKLAEHMLQIIILNTLPQSPRTGTGKSTKIIEKCFVTNTDIVLLTNLADVYGLHQFINKPTRVTDTSSTLIDVIFTNCPNKVDCSAHMLA